MFYAGSDNVSPPRGGVPRAPTCSPGHSHLQVFAFISVFVVVMLIGRKPSTSVKARASLLRVGLRSEEPRPAPGTSSSEVTTYLGSHRINHLGSRLQPSRGPCCFHVGACSPAVQGRLGYRQLNQAWQDLKLVTTCIPAL